MSDLFNKMAGKWYDIEQCQQAPQIKYITSAKFNINTYLKRLISSMPAGGSVVIIRTSSCMHWSWHRNWRSLRIQNKDNRSTSHHQIDLMQDDGLCYVTPFKANSNLTSGSGPCTPAARPPRPGAQREWHPLCPVKPPGERMWLTQTSKTWLMAHALTCDRKEDKADIY